MKKYLKYLFIFAMAAVMMTSVRPAFAAGSEETVIDSTDETDTQEGSDVKYNAGWVKISGKYFWQQEDGSILEETGPVKLGGYWYFLAKNHSRLNSAFKKCDGKYYYYGKNGKRYEKPGFKRLNGKWYYFLKDFSRYSTRGFKKISGQYYYFLKAGVRYSEPGFKKLKGEYYYFLKSGARYNETGFKKIDGQYYYFLEDGKLKMDTGLQYIDGSTYYFSKKHYILRGTVAKADGVLHFFAKNGKMLRNRLPFEWDGKHYRIDKNGVCEELSEAQAEASRLTWIFINKYSSSSDSNAVRFRKCFNRMECADYRPGYVKRSETNGTDWPYKIVVKVLRNTNRWTHNCYGFACTIASLAKELGYEPYVCVLSQDHAVVQINGKYYDNMGARFGASSPAIKGWKIYKKYKF